MNETIIELLTEFCYNPKSATTNLGLYNQNNP